MLARRTVAEDAVAAEDRAVAVVTRAFRFTITSFDGKSGNRLDVSRPVLLYAHIDRALTHRRYESHCFAFLPAVFFFRLLLSETGPNLAAAALAWVS